MTDIARRSPAELKPLASGLSAEVLDWAVELRRIWASVGLSLNRFASLHPIDKGTISRYLNGQRVPRDRWFLDKLLDIQADYGQPVTPAVREHLAELQLHALQVAHPHEYRVRRVNDELEIALTGKLEAERYARALEEQLADRNRRLSDLDEEKGRLRAAWDADRDAMQAERERLRREIFKIADQLHLAREREAQAERRCQILEEVLDHLDAEGPAGDKDRTDAKTRLLDVGTWRREAAVDFNRLVRTETPVAVALVDVNRFDAINYQYGPRAGGRALRAVADALKSQLQHSDLAGRFGDSEIAILLSYYAYEEDGLHLAERIHQHIAAMSSIPIGEDAESGPFVKLTVSVGVAMLVDGAICEPQIVTEAGCELNDLIANASEALRRAREADGNKTHVITRILPAMSPF